MISQHVTNDPQKRRTFHFYPSPAGELLDFTCDGDPTNEPLNAVYPEIEWSAPKYNVAAYHHEEVLFTVKDMTAAGQRHLVTAISSAATIPYALWPRMGEGCLSPAFRSPKVPAYDEPLIVEVVLVLVATGSRPMPNTLDYTAPPVRQVRRTVKIIWTPHVG